MKEVIFCFIEPYCGDSEVCYIAEKNLFAPIVTGDILRHFFKNQGFGDTKTFLEAQKYLNDGIILPIDLVLKIIMTGFQTHLQENLFIINATKYQELLQVLEKEGFKLRNICYIYHDTLHMILEYYKEKGLDDIAESIEYEVLKRRIHWQESIFDKMSYPLLKIGCNLNNFENFKENIQKLFL
ncbi:MAG: hypothetical protein MUC49_17485 [Raineya sp.]|jgi:adenylate kinase family enzyme|nr:hypothetical protein [Raineya sp.]